MSFDLDHTLARRYDSAGHAKVDYAALLSLALPLMVNSAIQSILNLTDTWFISRLSSDATAAMAGIYWPMLCLILFFGGVSFSVQTFASQCMGAGRYRRAAKSAWSGIYAAISTIPIFVALAFLGPLFIQHLPLSEPIQAMAVSYWIPRLLISAPLGTVITALNSFFSSVNAVRYTLIVSIVTAVANVPFNQYFMFNCHYGVAGSAYGTIAAQVVGLALAVVLFLGPKMRERFSTHLTYRRIDILPNWRLGIPMGFGMTADLIGLALFQLILVSISAIAGAATQIIMMLSSLSYMPGIGIAIAGTTFVGRSIGAHQGEWTRYIGQRIIFLCVGFMGVIGILIGLLSPIILPFFISAQDPNGPALLSLMSTLVWIAAAYQFFDGVNLGSAFCLRGAEDATVPAIITAFASFGVWIPLTFLVSSATVPILGISFIKGLGYGAVGGWWTTFLYTGLLGSGLYWRWRTVSRRF